MNGEKSLENIGINYDSHNRNPYYLMSLKATQFIFGLCEVTASGQENVPPNEPVVFAPTHRGFNDIPGIALSQSDRDLSFLAKKQLFIPLLNSWFRSAGVIPVDRSNPQAETFHEALLALHANKSLVIFPEQKVETGMTVKKIHRGFGLIACLAGGVKIIPTAIAGSEKLKRFYRPANLHVHFGEPILSKDLSDCYQPDGNFLEDDKTMRLILPEVRKTLSPTRQAMEDCLKYAHSRLAKRKHKQ